METRLAASHATEAQPLNTEATIPTLGGQLTAAAEALAQANTAFQTEVGQAEKLARELAERDEIIRRKDLLNREIDHRIKNSLQDIISLLRLQADRQKAPEVQAFAKSACARLEALAAAHELLHAANSPDRLDFRVYLERLCTCLRRSAGADGQHRSLILEADPVILPCEAAQALALVVNELVTNAFRPGEPGTVWVQCSRRSGGVQLMVADDGCGLPQGVGMTAGRGFGLQLVALMAGQVGARINVASKGGARVTLSFPIAQESARTG